MSCSCEKIPVEVGSERFNQPLDAVAVGSGDQIVQATDSELFAIRVADDLAMLEVGDEEDLLP